MEQQIQFAKALEELKELAKEQANVVSEEQVKSTFAFMDLNEEQLIMIHEYLSKCKIGIGQPVDMDDYLTGEEKDYLECYLEEIALLEPVSEGEKEAITMSAMAGDLDAQKRLIEIYLPQVIEIAKLYAGQGVFLEDLIGEGNVAVTMGVQMCGAEEKPAMVEGMIGKMIMDAMEELIAETVGNSKVDQEIVDKVNEITEKAEELAESLGRKVTPEELAEETEISIDEIMEAVRLSGNTIDYLEITNDGE